MKLTMSILAIAVAMSAAIPALAATEDWKQQFAKATDEYFEQVVFHYGPTGGTLTGFHQYDAQLEDYSRANIDAEIASLKQFEARIQAIHPGDDAADFVPEAIAKLCSPASTPNFWSSRPSAPGKRTLTLIPAPVRARHSL
jgi:hypothetical protein